MYRILLCLRYLRTRYIALASIVSVMLGVATMIVVNSVMSGFTNEMQARLHGILGDISLEAYSTNGFPDAQGHMEKIHEILGDDVEAMTPICTTAGIINYRTFGRWRTQEVIVIGIDASTKGDVGDFHNYLQHPDNRENLSFDLREGGYDLYDHQAVLKDSGTLGKIMAWFLPRNEEGNVRSSKKLLPRTQMQDAGWEHRRDRYSRIYSEAEEEFGYRTSGDLTGQNAASTEGTSKMFEVLPPPEENATQQGTGTSESVPALKAPDTTPTTDDPFGAPVVQVFDPLKEQHSGAIVGMGLSLFRENGEDWFSMVPGDDFKLTFPTNGTPPVGITDNFTCVDLYESKMSEYDSRFIFIPLQKMQELRGMADPSDPRMNRVNQIQIKMKPGVDLDQACAKLREVFDPMIYNTLTWQERQMTLLQAVQLEIAILNVLLFMIIAVSGFGILAIFYMVVIEKTQDIGVLKALGASSWGIMSIFLMYGLSLGIVGAGMGMVIGLLFVWNINEIADGLSWLLGHPVFDPDIYYFYQVPYDINPWTVACIVVAAMGIAVLASVFPAWRAARMQPVESLRYE
ncbi:MAG: FtsX-like permease family protein [Planctomycetia bacterium]|nr:FtsX-like permease family protein [Planctomycetia bacterium]